MYLGEMQGVVNFLQDDQGKELERFILTLQRQRGFNQTGCSKSREGFERETQHVGKVSQRTSTSGHESVEPQRVLRSRLFDFTKEREGSFSFLLTTGIHEVDPHVVFHARVVVH